MGFVSPKEMMDAAKQHMIEGREPESRKDWQLVMNFFASNIHHEVAESACLLMVRLYDMPLTNREVKEIVVFQQERRVA